MAEEGIDLGGYTIPEVFENLEEARMALGYEHVNLLSESYGIRVAQVYAAAHADRVALSPAPAWAGPVGPVPQPQSDRGAGTKDADQERGAGLGWQRGGA
jgi:pimeloyl-ACP methyl ester carboxylesterase